MPVVPAPILPLRGPMSDDAEVSCCRLEGRYANIFQVGHNAFEFVLEFGQANLAEAARNHTRIVTGPVYAKVFLTILHESVDRYEQAFGPIPESDS